MAEIRAPHDEPLRALILTDGKMGDLAQCRGVAEALSAKTEEIIVRPDRIAALMGIAAWDTAFKQAVADLADRPDLVIASGRRTIPYVRVIPGLVAPSPLTVFLKDPRTGPRTADLIWVPSHDRLRGSNIIVTDTSPHTHTDVRRRDEAARLESRLAPLDLPRPWLGVFLGGRSKKVTYATDTVAALTDALSRAASTAGSVLVTPSRRTPPELLAAIQDIHPKVWVWDGAGDNPYAGLLGACDAFFVTGDSHNMISEALSAGRHTIVFRPDGLPSKFDRFLDTMEAKNLVVGPQPADFDRHQPSINATPKIAEAIRARLTKRRRSAR